MKKLFATALLALPMVFAACSESESNAPEVSEKIGFISHVNKNSRATTVSLTKDNLTNFYVFGTYVTQSNTTQPIMVFNNELVSMLEGKWKYDETASRYWLKDCSYVFHAYSCNNASPGTTPALNTSTGNVQINGYLANDEHNHDLIIATATATGRETGNAAVAFDFKHALAKIKFTFEAAFPEGYQIKVSDVEVRNLRDKGNLLMAKNSSEWSSQNRTETENVAGTTYTLLKFPLTDPDKVLTQADKEVSTGDGFVIPFNYTEANVRLTFKVTVINKNNEETVTSSRGSFQPTWLMGKAYNYKVTLNGTAAGLEKIEFAVNSVGSGTGDGWEQGTDDIKFNFGHEVSE